MLFLGVCSSWEAEILQPHLMSCATGRCLPTATFSKDFPRQDASLRTWSVLLPIALTASVVSLVNISELLGARNILDHHQWLLSLQSARTP